MRIISDLLNENIVNAIGWTIFHILWQGFVLAFLISLLLRILNHKSSQIRYLISLSSLVIIVGLSILNFTSNYDTLDLVKDNQDFIQTNKTLGSLDSPFTAFDNLDKEVTTSAIIKNLFRKIDTLSAYFPSIVSLWFVGVLVFLIRFIFSFLYTSRLRTTGVSNIQSENMQIFNNIKNNLHVKRTVRFIESTLIKVPVVLGYLKPVVLVPAEILSGMPMNQIEAIVAHELAHIRRNDYIINVIQTIIETVFFFHPAVWYLSSKINNERENCCDDIALTVCDDSLIYAKALVSVQDLSLRNQYVAVAFSGRKKHLLNRIKRMIMKPKGKTNFTDKIIAATIILSAIVALSFTYTAEYPSERGLLNEIIESNSIEKTELTNPSEPTQPEVPTKPSIVEKINPPEIITVKDTTKDLHIRGEQYDIDNNTISKVTRTKNGKKEEMKFTLKNGKVTELYVDGKKVPDSEYGKYQSEIDVIIDDLKDAKIDIKKAMKEIENLDIEIIRHEMEEAMQDLDIDIKAAQEDIKRAMENVEMVDVEEIMRNVEIELNELDKLYDMDLDFDIDIDGESYHFDMGEINLEEIREQMKEVREEMREQIDMQEIQKEMLKVQEELSKISEEEIKIQMQESAKQLEEFNKQETIKELQEQLEELEKLELEEK